MKIQRRLLLLFSLVIVIVPVFNIGGCWTPYMSDLEFMKAVYYANYVHWSWEQRYSAAVLIEFAAISEGSDFSLLDLPTENIEVNDSAGADSGGTSGGGCSDSH
jgi:hypothetical protein